MIHTRLLWKWYLKAQYLARVVASGVQVCENSVHLEICDWLSWCRHRLGDVDALGELDWRRLRRRAQICFHANHCLRRQPYDQDCSYSMEYFINTLPAHEAAASDPPGITEAIRLQNFWRWVFDHAWIGPLRAVHEHQDNV